jgi:flagellar FliL protein
VGAALEYPATEAAVGLELEKRQHQLRDLFITEFSSRTLDELVDSRVKEEIREQLLAKLNTSVTSGHVTNLYFTEYVIQ